MVFFHIFKCSTQFDYILITVGIIFSILSGLLVPYMTYLLGNIFDVFSDLQTGAISNQSFYQKMNLLLIQFVILGVGSFVVISSMIICWSWTGERQSKNMKQIYLETLLKIGVDIFERNNLTIGGLSTSVNMDAENIRLFIADNIGYLIQEVVLIFSTLVIAFTNHFLLSLVTLVTTPILIIALKFNSKKASGLIVKERNVFMQAGNALKNALSNIKTVKAFNNTELEEKKHFKYLQDANNVSSQLAWIYGLRYGMIQFFFLSLFVQGFCYGTMLVANKKLRPGKVLSVFYSVMLGLSVLKNILPRIVSLSRAKLSISAFNNLLKDKTLRDLETFKKIKLSNLIGNIVINQVSFFYPNRPEIKVLKNINLTIPANKTTVIIGESGCGKSTVVQLIQKIYELKAGLGFITIDGYDIKTLNTFWLRQQIGVVNQDSILFDDTIFANIAYGKTDYWNTTILEIENVCKILNIHDFIMDLPEGYNTILGNKGNKLSGGQRQKIAIARALIKNPAILILDEACSAMDMHSGNMIQKALISNRKDKTTIIVTHQLKHVKSSDLVYVLNKGMITECGIQSELLKINNGYFNQFATKYLLHKKRRICEIGNKQILKTDNYLKTTSTIRNSVNLLSFDINQGSICSRKSWNFEDLLDIDVLQKTASAAVTKRNEIKDENALICNIISHYDYKYDVVTINDLANSDSKKKTENYKFKLSILKLIVNNMGNKLIYSFGIFASLINGFVMPLFSFVLANLLSAYSNSSKEDLVYKSIKFAVYVSLIAVVNGLSSYFKYYFIEISSEKLAIRLRHVGFKKILHQQQSWFSMSENATGKLIAILTADTELIKQLIGHFASDIVFGIISLSVGVICALINGWQLTLVGFGMVPLILIISEFQAYILNKYEKNQKCATDDATNFFYQSIESLHTVSSLAIEPVIGIKYRLLLEFPFKIGIKKAFICGFTSGLFESISYFTKTLSFWYGARLVSLGVYSLQRFFIVWNLIIFCTTSSYQIFATIPHYEKSKQAIKKITNIIKLPVKFDTDGIVPDNVYGSLRFVNVEFSYSEKPSKSVLNGINLFIKKGECIALFGSNGSGKSTIAALLQRIYVPNSGLIQLDGNDLNDLQLRWLRQNIGIVSQETELFDITIAENIAYGNNGATNKDIEIAAIQVNLHEFIISIPNGYDTLLSSNGIQLSGGQRQKIAIARAILKNPKILILDEATSALDTNTKVILQDTLNCIQRNRTTLVITHDIENVKHYDKIALIENGKIVEYGTHNELIANRDKYYSLIKS